MADPPHSSLDPRRRACPLDLPFFITARMPEATHACTGTCLWQQLSGLPSQVMTADQLLSRGHQQFNQLFGDRACSSKCPRGATLCDDFTGQFRSCGNYLLASAVCSEVAFNTKQQLLCCWQERRPALHALFSNRTCQPAQVDLFPMRLSGSHPLSVVGAAGEITACRDGHGLVGGECRPCNDKYCKHCDGACAWFAMLLVCLGSRAGIWQQVAARNAQSSMHTISSCRRQPGFLQGLLVRGLPAL